MEYQRHHASIFALVIDFSITFSSNNLLHHTIPIHRRIFRIECSIMIHLDDSYISLICNAECFRCAIYFISVNNTWTWWTYSHYINHKKIILFFLFFSSSINFYGLYTYVNIIRKDRKKSQFQQFHNCNNNKNSFEECLQVVALLPNIYNDYTVDSTGCNVDDTSAVFNFISNKGNLYDFVNKLIGILF